MKIALIGYGKMGKEIEKIALEKGHTIDLIIDIDNQSDLNTDNLSGMDVAVDFSIPSSAYGNIIKCFEANVPVVCGTTGWMNKYDEVTELCRKQKQTFFYAYNFSPGVNIFFRLNKYLAGIMNKFTDYDVEMEEIHHIHKKDAPSGTAITLAEDMLKEIDRKNEWKTDETKNTGDLKIRSVREGEVPGIHQIFYESEVDTIRISHVAKNRKGFATGAVLAAEFIRNKKGIYTMNDLLNF